MGKKNTNPNEPEPSYAENTMLDNDVLDNPEPTTTTDVDDTPPPDDQTNLPPEGVDTDPDTTIDDQDDDQDDVDPKGEPTPDDDVNTLFNNTGLYRQFTGVDDLIKRVPDMNRHITNLEQENARLKAGKTVSKPTQPVQPIDGDKLYDDPVAALKAAGIGSMEDMKLMVNDMINNNNNIQSGNQAQDRADTFIQNQSDWAKVQPFASAVFQQMPNLSRLPADEAVQIAYAMGKQRMGGKGNTVVEKSDPLKKSRATTSSGGGKKTKPAGGKKTAKDYAGMSIKQLEQELGFDEN